MEAKIIEIITAQLGIDRDKITPEARIMEDLGADSLDIVEMLAAAEHDTGVFVPDEDIPNLRTVGEIIEYFKAEKQE